MTFKCINTIVHYIPDPYTRHPYSVESWVCYPLIPAEFLAARRGKVAAKCWLGRHLLREHFFQISLFLLKKPRMIRLINLPNPSQFLASCFFFLISILRRFTLKKKQAFSFQEHMARVKIRIIPSSLFPSKRPKLFSSSFPFLCLFILETIYFH